MNNLSLTLQGHLRSKVMTPNERSYMSSYMYTIVTMSISCTVLMLVPNLPKYPNSVTWQIAKIQDGRYLCTSLKDPSPSYSLPPLDLKSVEICGRSSVFRVFEPNLGGAKVVTGGATRSTTFTSPTPWTIVTQYETNPFSGVGEVAF